MLPFILMKPEWDCVEMSKSGPTWTHHGKTGLLETKVKNNEEETVLDHSQRISFNSQSRVDETPETFPRKTCKWHICIAVRTETQFESSLYG